ITLSCYEGRKSRRDITIRPAKAIMNTVMPTQNRRSSETSVCDPIQTPNSPSITIDMEVSVRLFHDIPRSSCPVWLREQHNAALQRPGDNRASGKLSMRDKLIPV